MYRLIFIGFVTWLLSATTLAQDTLSFVYLNEKTYQYYEEGQWRQLISLGREGINSGIDYYYLRMRMGIAHFSQGKYHQSIPHFKNALLFNENDPVALEYLYFAYLYSGRELASNMVFWEMSPTVKKRIRSEPLPIVRALSLEFLRGTNQDQYGVSDFQNIDIDSTDASQVATRNYTQVGVILEHTPGKRLLLRHGYRYLGKTYTSFQMDENGASLLPKKSINQHQYYISGHYLIGSSVRFTAAYHYINVASPAYYLPGMGMGSPSTFISSSKSNQMVGYVGVSFDLPFVSFGSYAAAGNMGGEWQLQPGLFLSLYPLGNLNLYGYSKFSFTFHENAKGENNTGTILHQTLGTRLFDWWWGELHYTVGDLLYYIGGEGAILFNTREQYSQQFGASFIFKINSETSLSLSYFNGSGESLLYREDLAVETNNIDFNIHTINIALKWKF
jgi:tetratricopeptide (TPR) repeat protein